MDFQRDALSNCRVGDIGLEIGAVLNGRYRINDYVSLGNMTIMYRCDDIETKDTVLIKELAPITMVNRDLDGRSVVPRNKLCHDNLNILKKSFENEIEILIKLSDVRYGLGGCVPEYKEHFSENGTVYLVMSYFEGRNLQKRIADNEEINFRPIAKKIVDIVDKVHKAGIVHRDIKLSNILVKNDGNVVLLDFGSACKLEDEKTASRYVSNGFSPPELYDEKRTTRWVDSFTIGGVLYQMLTGVRPVRYNSQGEIYIVDISEYVNIPWPLALVIMKMLEPEPEKRLNELWVIKRLL